MTVYKVGDRVRLVKPLGGDYVSGVQGTVTVVHKDPIYTWPMLVEFDNLDEPEDGCPVDYDEVEPL